MMMEEEIPFETMVSFHQTTWRQIPEYSKPTETLKSKNSWVSQLLLLYQQHSAVCCGDLSDICPHYINIRRTDKRYPVNTRNGIKIESAVTEQTAPCSAPHPHNKLHHLYVISNTRQLRRGIPEEITERSPNKIKRLIFSTLFTRLVYTM
jgi:hypothetical protein